MDWPELKELRLFLHADKEQKLFAYKLRFISFLILFVVPISNLRYNDSGKILYFPIRHAAGGTKLRDRIFISYSHQDKKFKERLETHLKSYSIDEKIDYWSDTDILPGTDWNDAISESIHQATVAILLLSADFFASEYIRKKELPLLIDANKKYGVVLISIYLNSCNPCDEIKQLQYINSPDHPLARMPKQNREPFWARLAEYAVSALNEYKKAAAIYKNPKKLQMAHTTAAIMKTAVALALPAGAAIGALGLPTIGALAVPAVMAIFGRKGGLTLTGLFSDLFTTEENGNGESAQKDKNSEATEHD